MARTFVTGGAGFIGSHIIEALLERGDEIVALDNFSSGSLSNLSRSAGRIDVIEGDILDLDRLAQRIGTVDRIVHLAALISGYDSLNNPDDYVRVNITGTQRVIDFAARTGVSRILFASSSTVYGNSGDVPLNEAIVPQPLSIYALTKLASEHQLRLFAQLHGYSHCSLRLFNVYGPRQAVDHPYANVTCKFSHAAANGLPVNLYGDGDQSRDFIYVSDVVDAFLAVIDGSTHSLYNVGTGSAASINRLLSTVGGIAGTPPAVTQCAPWPNDIRSIRADISRLADEFGYAPNIALDEGLRRTIQFFADDRA